MNFNHVKCSEIMDVRDGTHDSPKYVSNGYPLVTSKNIKDNKIDFQNVNFISEEDFNKINLRSEVENGDILMPMIGTIGNPVLVNTEKRFAIKNVALFKLSKHKEIESKYFYYLLISPLIKRQLESNKRGGTQNFVSLSNIRDLNIPIISLEKQKYIVNILDKAQSLIDNRKAQIEALDELVKSRFIEMFGDPIINKNNYNVKSLNDICSKITDGTHNSPPNTIEGIPYVTARHLKEDGLDFYSNPTYVSNGDHEAIYNRCNPEKGDVLYIKDGATTGIAAINNYDFEFSMLSSLALLKLKSDIINNYYLIKYLNNKSVKENILNDMVGGAIKRLTLIRIKNIKVVVPPIELQNQFADFVNQVDKLKFGMEKSLKELEDNFNSLMEKAFSGELFNK